MAAVIYSFDRFELDTRLYQLRHEGQVIKLDRKAFDTLRFLVENRDRVVHKDELMRRLWPNEIVVEAVIPAAIRRIRRALGQARRDRRPIETAHGRGYRFASPATTVAPRVLLGTSRDAIGSEPPDPFVGRADLVAPLRVAERAAESGEGRLVLLSGEPGVGKTRLLQHLCHGAKTEGKSVWTGQCYEGDGAPAFWPWIQVVRQSLSELSARDIAQLPGEVVADLGLLVPELVSRTAPPARERDPDAARFRLYDSISRFLFRLSEAAYRLIVVDDLHWADHASLALLDFVAARLGERRLLVLAAVRTGELPKDHPNRERIDRLTRHTGALRVEVGGFNREEVAEYIGTLTGVLPSNRLTEQVFRRTGGNPLFTRETVRLFSRGNNGAVPLIEPTLSAPELPDAAKDVIRRRLQRLPEPARRVLELMSVGRGAFDLALIGAAASMDTESLLGALDASVQAGMLVKKAGSVERWAFAHDLMRDVVYEDVPSARRRDLHLNMARILEGQSASRDGSLGEIAFHYCSALPHEHVDRAVDNACRAATDAERVHAYEDAARLYELALDAARFDPELDEHRVLEVWLSLGKAHVLAGNLPEAERVLARCRDLARRLDSPVVFAEAALALRPVTKLWQSPSDEMRSALAEALELLPGDQNLLRARILASSAMAFPQALSMSARREMTREALELAAQAEDRDTTVYVQVARLHALQGPDDIEALLDASADIIALGRARALPEVIAAAHSFRGLAYLTLGDRAAATEEQRQHAQAVTHSPSPMEQWRSELVPSNRALAEGRFAEADRGFKRAHESGKLIMGRVALLVYVSQMHMLRYELGQMDLLKHFGIDPLIGEFSWAGSHLYASLAWFEVGVGRLESAQRLFEQLAAREFADVPRAAGYLATLRTLALVARALDDKRRAEALVELLERYSHLNAVSETFIYYGPVAHYLGLLEAMLGRHRQAAEHFEQALVRSERMGTLPMLARTQHELGTLLLASPSSSERLRAARLLGEARGTATRLGMAELRARIDAAEAPAHSPP